MATQKSLFVWIPESDPDELPIGRFLAQRRREAEIAARLARSELTVETYEIAFAAARKTAAIAIESLEYQLTINPLKSYIATRQRCANYPFCDCNTCEALKKRDAETRRALREIAAVNTQLDIVIRALSEKRRNARWLAMRMKCRWMIRKTPVCRRRQA